MKTLGIIPARGGSKGVVGKNLRLVAGQPLISYAIQAAQQSQKLTDFLVTTDSAEISRVAQEYGAAVLLRPPELAADRTPMTPVALHALAYAEQKNTCAYDALILLQPTSPIREGQDIDGVIDLLFSDEDVEGVISVCAMDDTHPARMYTLDGASRMSPLWPEWEMTQRQQLPVVYYRNGAIYAVKSHVLLEQQTLMPAQKKAYLMPRSRLANIDDERDLIITDVLVGLWKQGQLK